MLRVDRKIRHANIVPIIGWGEDKGTVSNKMFVVMPFINGITLE